MAAAAGLCAVVTVYLETYTDPRGIDRSGRLAVLAVAAVATVTLLVAAVLRRVRGDASPGREAAGWGALAAWFVIMLVSLSD